MPLCKDYFLSSHSRVSNIIRIHHECKVGLEKPLLSITDWHHEACRVMASRALEGRIFLSHFTRVMDERPHFAKTMKKTSKKY